MPREKVKQGIFENADSCFMKGDRNAERVDWTKAEKKREAARK
jgi:hypothetical protein